MATDDRMRELEEKYEGYTVYDNAGEKIGKVDDLFLDEHDREEYVGVKMGLFGLSGTTLIPMDVARVIERDRAIEVAESKERVKDAPSFDADEDITPDFEERIRAHFSLTGQEGSTARGSYGRYSGTSDDTTTTDRDAGDDRRGLDREGSSGGERREPVGREEHRNRDDFTDSGVTGTAASGAPGDLEAGDRTGDRTGDRAGDRGSGGEKEAYREAYREGFREGMREGMREAGGGEGRGDWEGAEDYQSASTGSRPSRGEPMDSGASSERGSERVGEEERPGGEGRREDRRRPDEGEQQSESTSTRVWRRIRS